MIDGCGVDGHVEAESPVLLDAAGHYLGPVIDAHIHLYDPQRPGGIVWPAPEDSIYRPRLPRHYWRRALPHHVVGAVVVEASPRLADNVWLHAVIGNDPRFLGFIGNLKPGTRDFRRMHGYWRAQPRFLGIRYGNLWQRDLYVDQQHPAFRASMRELAAAGHVLESANPDLRLLHGLLKLSDAVPELRMVIDHLPNARIRPQEQAAFLQILDALATRPHCHIKLSEIPQRHGGEHAVVRMPHFYRARLEALWSRFGEDRCVFGSDWPNSDHLLSYAATFHLVQACMARHSAQAQRKFFHDNALRVYGPRSRQA